MITNSERQEIVRSLRRGVSYMFLVKRWRNGGLDRVQTFSEYLADLMDRPTFQLDGNPAVEYVICNRCVSVIKRDAVSDCCKVIPVRYCPNCGAEVVE